MNKKINDSYLGGDTVIYEAYKQVRVKLIHALAAAKSNIMLISSQSPDEGKTTTAAYLGTVIAQTHSRVIIVDADMRKPRLHKYMRLDNKAGLAMYLSGICGLDEAVKQVYPPYLDVITAGFTPPNPTELLASEKMDELLETLSKKYDYVIIDTPPINVVSDCLNLVSKTAGVVLVAKQRKTKYSELQYAMNQITDINGSVLAVIINDVKNKYKAYSQRYYTKYYE